MTPQTESPQPAGSLSINALGIFSSPLPSAVPSHYHPSKSMAAKLWTKYVDMEGCLCLKLLHLPTDEVKIYSIIDSPDMAPLDDLSFSFAIYFAATSALEDDEAQAMLGSDRHALLLRFKVGLEQSFAHGNFLNHPTVTGLHALSIYLVSYFLCLGVLTPLMTKRSQHFEFTTVEREFGFWMVLQSG